MQEIPNRFQILNFKLVKVNHVIKFEKLTFIHFQKLFKAGKTCGEKSIRTVFSEIQSQKTAKSGIVKISEKQQAKKNSKSSPNDEIQIG